MPGTSTIFVCSNCGAQFQKWIGRCLECGKWGMVQQTISPRGDAHAAADNLTAPAETKTLNEIEGKTLTRLQTGIGEFDRVTGGGIVPGSIVLLGGEPGIGKSTLALQLATLLSDVLYFSGEESVEQIKLRANRLPKNTVSGGLKLANETNVEKIIATINQAKPKLAIIDSVQTAYSDDAASEPGGPTQIRAVTAKLMALSKQLGVAVILIGQVTKDGEVAGPKTLEHLVDTVLYLEGDRFHEFRVLRAVKNRFGSTDEVGIFAMEEDGLKEVKNPSQAFLNGRPTDVPGSAVACLMEGTRPLLVEIQALVAKTAFGYPQRKASGFDLNRLQVLIAVLSRRTGLPLDTYDVFLNVIGGLRADEPAADLAVVLAIASAIKNKVLPANLVSFGEVGLGGEARGVSHAKKRLEEIKNLGFEFAVMSHTTEPPKIAGLKIAAIKNVQEVVEKIVQ